MLNNILFLLVAIFWGGSFVAIKYLIHDVSPFTAAFYRVFFALIFLSLFFVRKLRLRKDPALFKEILLSMFTGVISIGVPFSLLFWGEMYIAPSLAGLLNGTVPFWTTILAIFIFKHEQRITQAKVLGLILGFIGILFIFGPKITMEGKVEEIMGLCAIIVMSFSYAVGINLNRKYLAHNKVVTTEQNLVIQHIASSLYLFALVLIIEGPIDLSLLLKPVNALSVLYLSLFSTCIAFIIFFRLIKEIGPIRASSVTFFVPAVAIILDIVINKAYFTIYEAIGAAIIFISMSLLNKSKKA